MKKPPVVSFVLVLVLCAAAFGMLYRRQDVENVPKAEPLVLIPSEVNEWRGIDRPLDEQVVKVLGRGEFLSRMYHRVQNGRPETLDLFVGYFPSQRTGETIHSPKNCLPGSGWQFASTKHADLSMKDGRVARINETVIAKGTQRQLVLYWYQAHGRAVASEYWAKIYLVTDAIRMNRTDGALVRIVTPYNESEPESAVRARAYEFAAQLAPELDRFIPL